MRTPYKVLTVALLAASLAACHKKPAGGDDTVLATVNGKPITQATLHAFIRTQQNGQDMDLNPQQEQALLHTVINLEALADSARKAGLDKQADMQQQLQVSSDIQLAQSQMESHFKGHEPTDADIKAAYDQQFKDFDPHQYKARHILVKDESQAKDIIAQLNKGADFAKLAQKYSLDSGSARNGGELDGWFYGARMVPEFAGALTKLKKGQYTQQPVKSQFGWHVIQLEDVRDQPPPSLDQMRQQIAEDLQQKQVRDYLEQVKKDAKVVIKAPAGASGAAPAPVSAAAPQP